ncbi:hypothetical protein ES708_11640 [subsurface metagenome]
MSQVLLPVMVRVPSISQLVVSSCTVEPLLTSRLLKSVRSLSSPLASRLWATPPLKYTVFSPETY